MCENIAVIPKGTKIQIMGCSYFLLEDVKVDAIQVRLEQVLEAQNDFENEVHVVDGKSSLIGMLTSV